MVMETKHKTTPPEIASIHLVVSEMRKSLIQFLNITLKSVLFYLKLTSFFPVFEGRAT